MKEINKRVTIHTLSYRSPDAVSGEYTTTDMAAGDTAVGLSARFGCQFPLLNINSKKQESPCGNSCFSLYV